MENLTFSFQFICCSISHWFYAIVFKLHSTSSVATSGSSTNTFCHVSEGRLRVCCCTGGYVMLTSRAKWGHTWVTIESRANQLNSHILPHAMENKRMVNLGEAERKDSPGERKQLLPAATHQHITPVTSYTPHFIWNAVARQELHGNTHSFVLADCFVICSASLSAHENLPAEKTDSPWQTQEESETSSETLRLSSLHNLSSCGKLDANDLCDSSWWGDGMPGSEATTGDIMGQQCVAHTHNHLHVPSP